MLLPGLLVLVIAALPEAVTQNHRTLFSLHSTY